MSYNIIRYDELGGAEFGWLSAKHHFSFGSYYDPKRISFGSIRVINDDLIAPHKGFSPHPHDNMEIITFVREGAITHKDNLGNHGRTEAGDVQVMSAGTGITHSEYNMEDITTNIYQIWIFPDKKDVAPRWESGSFIGKDKNKLNLLVSGFNSDKESLKIHQDVNIYSVQFDAKDKEVHHQTDRSAYLLVSKGSIEILGNTLHKGDAIEINNESVISFISDSDQSEAILIETRNG